MATLPPSGTPSAPAPASAEAALFGALQAVAAWPAAELQAWCALLQAASAAAAPGAPAAPRALLQLLLAHARAAGGALPNTAATAADADTEALRQQTLAALLALAVT